MCEGGSETVELRMSSVAMLRQRGLELYVIINKATWLHYLKCQTVARNFYRFCCAFRDVTAQAGGRAWRSAM